MSVDLPVVFLAFANDQDNYLPALKAESRAAFRILQPLVQQGLIQVHREESSTTDELYSDLVAHRGKVVLFHYAGHADGESLWLEGGQGNADGIAALLATQADLRLVFLNGCATLDQVRELHAAGVPAVIATSVKINDDRATRFSHAFYEALAGGQSLFDAFESACAFLETQTSDGLAPKLNRYPRFDFDAEEAAPVELEWGLYVREECREELAQWRLTEAREHWQLALSDSRGPVRNIDGAPLLVDYRVRRCTVEVSQCGQCGTAILDFDIASCPVCQYDAVSPTRQTVQQPDLLLASGLNKDAVRQAVMTALADTGATISALARLYLPVWAFDIDCRIALTGERGVVRDPTADVLEHSWEPVTDEFVLQLRDYVVSATTAAPGPAPDWDWSLDGAQPLESLADAPACAPADLSLETCFKAPMALLDEEIDAEASERIGGLQQRNRTLDVRYGAIATRLVLLPYWYATVAVGGKRFILLIHGGSGAIQELTVAGMTPRNEEIALSMSQVIQRPGAATEKASSFVSVFAGVGIGIMVGLLLGLAAPASPGARTVVSVFIGAVGVGLAALLGLNDRYFSNAKGLRIGTFGLSVALSAMAGIYVRDHGLISPGLEARVAEVRAVFPSLEGPDKDERVIALLTAMDSGAAVEGETSPGGINLRSLQYSGKAEAQSICDKLQLMARDNPELTTALVLRNFRFYDKDAQLGWYRLADRAEESLPEQDIRNFLLTARDAVCGSGSFDKALSLDPSQCRGAGTATTDWAARLAATGAGQAVLDVVSAELSMDAREPALAILGEHVCSFNEGG